jgi:hypothetical protein
LRKAIRNNELNQEGFSADYPFYSKLQTNLLGFSTNGVSGAE